MGDRNVKSMWSHYCWSERCTISLLAGESCNWCDDTPQITLEGLEDFLAASRELMSSTNGASYPAPSTFR